MLMPYETPHDVLLCGEPSATLKRRAGTVEGESEQAWMTTAAAATIVANAAAAWRRPR
jgi:hypothetical protein